jgi:hypothetical protein
MLAVFRFFLPLIPLIQSKEQSSDEILAKLPANFTHLLLCQFRILIGSRANAF